MAALNVAQAQQIASCKQYQGQRMLAEFLGLGPYGEERNLQNAIRVDFLHDHMTLAVSKGFTWEQVCSVVEFAQDFLADCAEKSLTQMVKTYQARSAELITSLGQRNYKIYTDFLFSTFFTHFQLYKHVLSNSREENIPRVGVDIHTPIPPLPLASAKELSVWNYEASLSELEKREAELEEQRRLRKQQLEAEATVNQAACQSKVDSVQTPFTHETLGEMIRSVLQDYATATSKAIATEIKDVADDLQIKFEKTSLPRPAALGPPPRYSPKPPVQLLPKTAPSKANNKLNVKNEKSKLSAVSTPPRSRGGSSKASMRHQ
ncbi:hypothetical protein BaRGS_00000500 [Batillaria attramentaria]|uniref:Uncharacterized protein n=1 Tax=Batillaria attramentaria TaxID=370345 RepID=A0ABD0MAJ0_9CAEN